MPVVETFFGYVETTKDSLLLLEACRQGSLPRVRRRLQEQERQLVKSGAIFCFDENESGIKRWTDGLVWSPSRILGNFLIYRELEDRKKANDDEQDSNAQLITSGLTLLSKRQRERSLVGALRNTYRFKPNGLVKKSMSVVVNGVHQHLVSYYNKDDVLANKFQTPTENPELASIEISTELLCGQNFRIPFFLGGTSQNPNSFGEKNGVTNKRSATEKPTKQKRSSSTFNHQVSRKRYSNNISSPSLSVTSGSSSSYSSDLMQETPPYSTTTSSPVNNQSQLLSDTSTNSFYPTCDHYQQQQDTFFYLSPPSVPGHHESIETQPIKRQRSQQTEFTDDRYGQVTNHCISSIASAVHGIGSDTTNYQHWTPHSFSTGYSNDRFDQNPHQHLFSSTSFHSINHAAIPTRTTELTSNAFMLDTSALLGSGWNDFEMQM